MMTNVQVRGDQVDYNPRKKSPDKIQKDDERNAPESGDKQPD